MSAPHGDPRYQDPQRHQTPHQSQPFPTYESGYGQIQAYGTQPEHPQATVVLILGILGFFVGITGPIAWIMGSKARQEVRANPGRYRDGGTLQVGWILGIVTTALMAVGVIFAIIYLVFIVALIAGYGGF